MIAGQCNRFLCCLLKCEHREADRGWPAPTPAACRGGGSAAASARGEEQEEEDWTAQLVAAVAAEQLQAAAGLVANTGEDIDENGWLPK